MSAGRLAPGSAGLSARRSPRVEGCVQGPRGSGPPEGACGVSPALRPRGASGVLCVCPADPAVLVVGLFSHHLLKAPGRSAGQPRGKGQAGQTECKGPGRHLASGQGDGSRQNTVHTPHPPGRTCPQRTEPPGAGVWVPIGLWPPPSLPPTPARAASGRTLPFLCLPGPGPRPLAPCLRVYPGGTTAQ